MSSSLQQDLSSYKDKPLSSRIMELLQTSEGHRWQGTAHALCEVLDLPPNFAPRALAVRLKKSHGELKKVGVTVRYKKLHGIRVVSLSLSHSNTAELMKQATPIPSTISGGVAKSEEPISFPFRWAYGTVTELSEEEKNRVNHPVSNRHNRHFKHCSLCGRGGPEVLQYRKTSNGYNVFLCRSCAEQYVVMAMAKELKRKKEEI